MNDMMMPLLMFLAGAGFNEVAYAVDKLQKGVTGLTGSGQVAPPGGLPQIMNLLGGAQPPTPPPSPQQQLGPNPLQALAMLDLKRRMAMMPDQMLGGTGQPAAVAPPVPAVGRFGGQPGAMAAFQQMATGPRPGMPS